MLSNGGGKRVYITNLKSLMSNSNVVTVISRLEI
jgi:hypothetical protein